MPGYGDNAFLLKEITDSNKSLTADINGVSKDITASTLGLRDAVERGNLNNSNTTERTAAQTIHAVERNSSMGLQTTERVGANAAVTSERIGGNIMTAIERVAAEGRLTTTVTDAASRQAAADSARDISVSVERTGGAAVSATQKVFGQLSGAVERNAGETRSMLLQSGSTTQSLLTDVRHSILNDVNRGIAENQSTMNRGTNEILLAQTQTSNYLGKAVTDSAWENRTATASSILEQLKMGESIKAQSAAQYASILLENAKAGALLSTQSANEYSSMLLEQQKMKEYLASKGDNQFAMTQLELQKVKEGLACQAAQNFSISQLEQQKLGSLLSAQMADAKYEALKSQQYVTDKMEECCCSVKEKIDTVDRDRLRDSLTVEKNDNNILKIIELTQLARGGWDDRRGDRHHRR
jgi:hypothetical protein